MLICVLRREDKHFLQTCSLIHTNVCREHNSSRTVPLKDGWMIKPCVMCVLCSPIRAVGWRTERTLQIAQASGPSATKIAVLNKLANPIHHWSSRRRRPLCSGSSHTKPKQPQNHHLHEHDDLTCPRAAPPPRTYAPRRRRGHDSDGAHGRSPEDDAGGDRDTHAAARQRQAVTNYSS